MARTALGNTCRLHRRWTVRYSIEIPVLTVVGPGLNHKIGGIVVNQDAVLGHGVMPTPGVVIGNNAGRSGSPAIGNNVVLHTGAKVIGALTIGDGVQVGANAVVTRDLSGGSVAAGVPARVLDGRTPPVPKHTDFSAVLGPPPARGQDPST